MHSSLDTCVPLLALLGLEETTLLVDLVQPVLVEWVNHVLVEPVMLCVNEKNTNAVV